MLVRDMKSVGKGASGSGDSLNYHFVTAHGACGIPVSALSNPMKTKDIGIWQTWNVRFQDLPDLFNDLEGSI